MSASRKALEEQLELLKQLQQTGQVTSWGKQHAVPNLATKITEVTQQLQAEETPLEKAQKELKNLQQGRQALVTLSNTGTGLGKISLPEGGVKSLDEEIEKVQAKIKTLKM